MSTIRVVFFDLGNTLVGAHRDWLPGAQTLLGALHQAEFRLGIISNTGSLATREAILALLPPDFDLGLFEAPLVLFSSELGNHEAKPGAAIFRRALARANVPANQCLYCGEDVVETLVAQHVGMRTIRVQTRPNSDLGDIENHLKQLDLVVSEPVST